MSVVTFVWDDLFITGLDSVDEQHHRLIDLVNELSRSFIDGENKNDGAIQEIIGKLADYAIYHFSEEERLMAEAAVDPRHTEHHISIHRKFVEQIDSMWNARHSMASPASVLLEFLIAWLSFHILGEDQALARQIQRIRAGGTPAAAYEAEEAPHDRTTAALLGALRNLYHVLSEQNQDLASSNQRLEARVAERTRELEVVNQRLELLSRTDGLLGIANRMYFDDRIKIEWKLARRNHQPIAVLMMDVDHFKAFNDSYGHQKGDVCLRKVSAAAAAAMFRPTDLLARYGGEELVALLPSTDLEGACAVAERIRGELARLAIPHCASAVARHVTLSIGVAAMYPQGGAKPGQLISAADRALYEAKREGRNRIAMHRPEGGVPLA